VVAILNKRIIKPIDKHTTLNPFHDVNWYRVFGNRVRYRISLDLELGPIQSLV